MTPSDEPRSLDPQNNADHAAIGCDFQEHVRIALENRFQRHFSSEQAIKIGHPPKEHKFDLVSDDRFIVVECKCYTWTVTGHVPSGKIRALNEAALFLEKLPAGSGTVKILAMKKSVCPERKSETLAEYYVRCYGHLLDDIWIAELDETDSVRWIR